MVLDSSNFDANVGGDLPAFVEFYAPVRDCSRGCMRSVGSARGRARRANPDADVAALCFLCSAAVVRPLQAVGTRVREGRGVHQAQVRSRAMPRYHASWVCRAAAAPCAPCAGAF